MNKREAVLNLISSKASTDYIPAAFFMHFGRSFHQGQAAIDKHLEFFRFTGMDFVKIQYEQSLPAAPLISKPQDWAQFPRCSAEFFETTLAVVEGLVKAVQPEALVIMTLYSPLMWAEDWAGDMLLSDHLHEDPEEVKKGLEIITENVLPLVRGCKRVGVDGFYASSQGGEAFRFRGTDIFQKYIRPTDLAVWEEIKTCTFNVLHVCDYRGGYDDLSPFLIYPGNVVNCSLNLGDRTLTAKEVSQMFGRPFMGGLDRKGVIAAAPVADLRRTAEDVLASAPEQFILAADCTVPGDTPWENLKTVIEMAHNYRRKS